MSRIQRLGYDILYQIMRFLSSDTTNLLDCILVCKSWRDVAQPLLDRRIEYSVGSNSKTKDTLLIERLKDETFKARVKELTVGNFRWNGQCPTELNVLLEATRTMRLKTLLYV